MHLSVCNHWSMHLSNGLHIYTDLVSTSQLGVGRQGGLSSHKVYTCLLAHLESALNRGLFVLQSASSNTLNFRQNIEGSDLQLSPPFNLLHPMFSGGGSEDANKLIDYIRAI